MSRSLTFEDDVMREVEHAAAAQHTSVEAFVLSAVRRALPLRIVTHAVSGLPVFELPDDVRPFADAQVRRADDDDDDDDEQRDP